MQVLSGDEWDHMVNAIQEMLRVNGIIEIMNGREIRITERTGRLIVEYTSHGQQPQQALQNAIVTMVPQATFLEVHGMLGFMISFLRAGDERIGKEFGYESFHYDVKSVYSHLKMNGGLK